MSFVETCVHVSKPGGKVGNISVSSIITVIFPFCFPHMIFACNVLWMFFIHSYICTRSVIIPQLTVYEEIFSTAGMTTCLTFKRGKT